MNLKEKIRINVKLPSKRTMKIVTFTIVALAGGSLGGIGTNKAIKFFRENTIIIQSPIKITTQKAFEVVTLKEYDRRQRENQIIEDGAKEIIQKIQDMDKPEVTDPNDPTLTKEESGISQAIIKPVEAKEPIKYTYTAYSKRKYYGVIIEGLKKRYVNWEAAAELQAKEGMFDPSIRNPTSGACGLPQALPCEKMKCPLNASGIDCQLDWQKQYVTDRYGTITNALEFRIKNIWY